MSIWQSSAWNTMLQKTSQVSSISHIGEISVQKRSIGMGHFGLFVMGVHPSNTVDETALIDLCKKEKCLFVQVESLDYTGTESITIGEQFTQSYYKKFITPYTAVIDLEESEEEILAKMKPKGRYNIKLARKKGVTVEKVEKTDENIRSYFELSQETTARDKFAGHNLEYYKTFLQEIPNSELLLAKVDGQIIAGGIFVFDSEVSYYYYGASTSQKEYRNLMAPYLLQWTAIEHAKKSGSKLYDFLGIAGEGSDYDESLAGVTDFKLKLTPDSRKVSESYMYISQKYKYFIFTTIKKIKKRFL